MKQEDEIRIKILKQSIEELQNEQQGLVTEFDSKNKEIEEVLANYNTKIEALQREGQQIIDKLDNEREQLRGSYQTLTKLIEGKEKELSSLSNTLTEVKVEDTKVKTAKGTKKSKEEKVEIKEEVTLTDEQIKAIENITNSSEFKGQEIKNQDKKNGDIPDYLQEEYNKLDI